MALQTVEEADCPSLREGMIETTEECFDESDNSVVMEYLLTRATVTR